MRIVVDSNRVIASLLKGGATRRLLFNKDFEFIAPDFIISEISKYKNYIIKKVKISSQEFGILLALFFDNIKVIPKENYKKFIKKLEIEIGDKKDIPYLAVCLATNSQGIWTHDNHFKQQDKIKIFSNMDLLRF